MIDLQAVYDGVGDALRQVDGLRVADLGAELPPPPVAVVLPPDIDFTENASISWCWCVATVPVLLSVTRPTERIGRVQLTEWLPKVVDALGKDSTFAGSVGDSTVVGAAPSAERDLPGYVVSVRCYVPR